MLRDSIDYKGTAVGKLFRRFLFPTVMGMVFSAVFVITDGIFVGRGIGSDALAAVNLTAPLFTLGTGLGLMFGMGGSVMASVNLAQGKRRVAQINITQSLFVPALLIVLLSALLILCHKPLLLLLGTPPELMVPAREYLVWFTLFLTPLAVFNILMFIVRLDGAPRFAMACNIMAASINIVLDYLFIFEFGWGLAGAAIATGVGYIVGSGVMLRYMLRHSRTLHFVKFKTSYKSLRLTARNLGYMTYIGFPALLSELAISCLMVVGNYTFIRYTGKDGVAAYSIACYIFPIIFMVYNGIIQSAQPIISYNYGAGLMRRGRKALANGARHGGAVRRGGVRIHVAMQSVDRRAVPDARRPGVRHRRAGTAVVRGGLSLLRDQRRDDRLLPEHRTGTARNGTHRSARHRADDVLLSAPAAYSGRDGYLARGTRRGSARNTAARLSAAQQTLRIRIRESGKTLPKVFPLSASEWTNSRAASCR